MARNRKRSRDRRSRPPAGASSVATANGEPVEAPQPLRHATPDQELAEAQLALGRPDLTDVPDDAELEALAEGAGAGGGRGRGTAAGEGGEGGGNVPAPAPAHPAGAAAHSESVVQRLTHFLVGSWHELQRVQWPDRRQVFQATGVVIGFVIVAGVFLGVADVVAQKVVNLILYGHG